MSSRDPKSYKPVCSPEALRAADSAIKAAVASGDASEIVTACANHGTKIGYKAFCYLLTGKVPVEIMIANQNGTEIAPTPEPEPEPELDLLARMKAKYGLA